VPGVHTVARTEEQLRAPCDRSREDDRSRCNEEGFR
jgi:hypothetical protein